MNTFSFNGKYQYSQTVITRIVAPMALMSDQEAGRAKLTFVGKQALPNIALGNPHFQTRQILHSVN